MASRSRFDGPVLTNLKPASLFSGEKERERMAAVRLYIKKVRDVWDNNSEYAMLKGRIRNFIQPERYGEELRQRFEALLAGFSDWADIKYNRPTDGHAERYTAIELYSSKEGYDYLFGLTNDALRKLDVDEDLLLTVVTIVEFLTIELYNLRLSNIGDPKYSNFQGITYRGLGISSEEAQAYRAAASHEDLSQRHYSVPLGFMSSSVERQTMEQFALQNLDLEPMHMTIHIYGLDQRLLQRYEQKYNDSIVTSICAMPIGRIAEYGEKEVLLRGPAFHIIWMDTVAEAGRNVHKIEVVMLNSNRDHGTEHASDEGEKKLQRQFFFNVILSSRYEICAALARKHSVKDAEEYERLARAARQKIDEADLDNAEVSEKPDAHWADSKKTWLGGSSVRSYPQAYARARQNWQDAISQGRWADATKILQQGYDWQRAEWFNVARLRSKSRFFCSVELRINLHRQRVGHGAIPRWLHTAS
jgi:hypothetical protein